MVQLFRLTRSNDVITTPQHIFHENKQKLNRRSIRLAKLRKYVDEVTWMVEFSRTVDAC